MVDEAGKVASHRPLPDIGVPIAIRAERRLRIVDVKAAQSLEADACVEFGEEILDRGRIGDIEARHPGVARIDAEAEARMVDGLHDRGELGRVAADRAARAG